MARATDTERSTRQKRKLTLAIEQREKDLVEVMSTPAGRRVLWDIIDRQCNLHGGSFVPDGLRTAFNEGKRHVGLELRLAIVAVTPLDYVHMLSEQLAPDSDEKSSPQPEDD